jgi:hypothetical protein
MDNCPWCWAELRPDDIMCPECRQQARRASELEPTSPASPLIPDRGSQKERAPRKGLPSRAALPPIPPAKRGEFIVTNPEKAPLWQRFALVMYKVWRFLLKYRRDLFGMPGGFLQ